MLETLADIAAIAGGLAVLAAVLRGRGAEYEQAAISIVNVYETIGLLVFRGAVSFGAVREACGGMLALHWKKLRVWVTECRAEQSNRRFAEWFQWLAERVGEREASRPALSRQLQGGPRCARPALAAPVPGAADARFVRCTRHRLRLV